MTALIDTVDIIDARHESIVTAFDLSTATSEMLATEALEALSIDPTDAALLTADVPNVRLSLDVVVWRWVEARTALGFDFSADGGSYHRSQLAAQATKMRQRAEDRAAAGGLDAYAWPAVEYDKPVNNDLDDEWPNRVSVYQW